VNDFNKWVEILGAKTFWEKYDIKGERVNICIVDSGVDPEHEILKEKIKGFYNVKKNSKEIFDNSGHGTHVAGIITSFAPESNIYVANSIQKNNLSTMTEVVDGITYAKNIKADILCLSLGSVNELPQIVEQRLKKASQDGMIIVCAVGNSGKQRIDYPAKYDFTIAVGGTDDNLMLSKTSNYGFDMDFVMPSEKIVSSHLNNTYIEMSGTSMATPALVGIVSLIVSYNKKNNKGSSFESIYNILKDISDREYSFAKEDKKDRFHAWGTPNLNNFKGE
jgi:subtilisin family serine protease